MVLVAEDAALAVGNLRDEQVGVAGHVARDCTGISRILNENRRFACVQKYQINQIWLKLLFLWMT